MAGCFVLLSDWLQCAFLEATNCQVESRYLGVLRKLQETKSLDPEQQRAVQKMVEDALRGELKSVCKLSSDRWAHLSLTHVGGNIWSTALKPVRRG